MTDGDEPSSARAKTAQNPISDSAFVMGALAALAGIALGFLETNLQPLWFFGGAIVFLATGSLARSATVVRAAGRDPEWKTAVEHAEARIADATERNREIVAEQAGRNQAATQTLESNMGLLSKRFDGMEQWVAKNAVPLVQNPEPIIAPIVRRLTRNATQDLDAFKEDLKGLRRQCEGAVRAFAALPAGAEMATWPATMASLDKGLVTLKERIESVNGDQPKVAQEVAALRHAITDLNAGHAAGKERWHLVERECETLKERLASLKVPSEQDIGHRLEALKTSILTALPDPEEANRTLRAEVAGVAAAAPAAQAAMQAVAALRKEVEEMPARIDGAIATLKAELMAARPVARQPEPGPQHEPQPEPHAEPARVPIVPGSQKPLRAHNPHAVDHGHAIGAAKAKFDTKKGHLKQTPKGEKRAERQRRLEETRKHVARPRRR